MEGTQLFVTDVDLTALVEDDRFYYVLRSVHTFLKATNPFKLLVSIMAFRSDLKLIRAKILPEILHCHIVYWSD